METDSGIVFKIKKYAIHDGPGIRTTLFLKGCPLNCWWCHNPEGQQPESQPMMSAPNATGAEAVVGWTMSVDDAITEIEKDILFYDESGGGVTFSGGEPLMQATFLQALLRACHEREIHTAVDTSGYSPVETFAMVLPLVDLILFDLKIMDEEKHRHYTGVSNRDILENLKALFASETPHRIRFPVIPGITDTEENIRQVAEFLQSLGTVGRIDLLPLHRIADEKYRRLGMQNNASRLQPPSLDKMTQVLKQFEKYGFDVRTGG
jgi:pyruvate formate lyase activating enzyme